MSVNWPYPISEAFIAISGNEVNLSPLFTAHIRDIKHWTLGPEMAMTFPFMACVPQTVQEESSRRNTDSS